MSIDLKTFQLREGMQGPVVLASQDLLEDAEFTTTEEGTELIIDGEYGPVQTGVVKVAQARLTEEGLYHSTIDGDLGSATLLALLDKTGRTIEDFEEMVEDAEAYLSDDNEEAEDDDEDEEFDESEAEQELDEDELDDDETEEGK